METPCEVMQSASSLPQPGKADGGSWNGESYSCYWFGIGCPVDDSCAPELSAESVERLIELSNPDTLQNEYDARYRVAAIADIFEAEPDPIGMFSIVYRHITNNAVPWKRGCMNTLSGHVISSRRLPGDISSISMVT